MSNSLSVYCRFYPTASQCRTVRSTISPVMSTTAVVTGTASPSASAIPVANSTSSNATTAAAVVGGNSRADILVIARDATTAKNLASGFNGYGIPYSTLIVPQAGTALPALNTSGVGNYGGILVHGQVAYDYGGTLGFQSALTADQWNQLYAYQTSFGTRMVHLDVYPGPLFGTNVVAGCCNTGVEQLMSFSNTAAFPQAGLKTGATVSTSGLYHYAAAVADTATTSEIAQFAANGQVATTTTAAVINNFSGRQQMVFFIGWATEWSPTSNFLQHAYITWMTRGLYAGYRRVNLNTQIDDMFLITDVYKPAGTSFRLRAADLTAHAAWVPTINAKMNPGSFYVPEIGHNGNGNIEQAQTAANGGTICAPGSIEYDTILDTPLEYQKPLGSGTNMWPATPTAYGYTAQCNNLDPLKTWFSTAANRDQFAHLSHTYTHMELNNATYSDAVKEIKFNQAWLSAVGLADAKYFSANGLIPPAITGLHNGDVLKAWRDSGLTNCVGDNTRPLLRNPNNDMYPYITNFASNGYDGFQVNPRWATRIYYNCDSPDCTASEWVETSSPAPNPGDFNTLLATEKADTARHLFGLQHDSYMFHQANLRQTDVAPITINGVSSKISIFQAWVEVQVQEFVRLVNWPMITLKHSDVSLLCRIRMNHKLTTMTDVGFLRRSHVKRFLRIQVDMAPVCLLDYRCSSHRHWQFLLIAHSRHLPCWQQAKQHPCWCHHRATWERPLHRLGQTDWSASHYDSRHSDFMVDQVDLHLFLLHLNLWPHNVKKKYKVWMRGVGHSGNCTPWRSVKNYPLRSISNLPK